MPLGPSLSAGLAVLGASSLLAAASDNATLFLLSRFTAGIGLTILVTVLPAAIASVDAAGPRRAALIMWGSFLPLGTAFGTGLAAVATTDWRTTLALHGLLCAAAALVPLRSDWRRRPEDCKGPRLAVG